MTIKKRTLWEASPTAWLLLPQIIFLLLGLILSLVALMAHLHITVPIPEYVKFASFLSKNVVFTYGIWSVTGFVSIITFAKYLKIKFENYSLTDKSITFNTGVLNRSLDETMLFRVVDTAVELPLFLRLIGRGHVVVYSSDPSDESSSIKPSITTSDGRKGVYFAGIKDPISIKALIDSKVNEVREKQGIQTSELM